MDIFGYNLTDNKLNFIKNTLATRTDISGENYSNLYFGYSSRSNSEWGNSVNLLTNISTIPFADGTENPTTNDYYVTFFGESASDGNMFKVIRLGMPVFSGTFGLQKFQSNWIMVEKMSTEDMGLQSISFEELLSNQNSSGIVPDIKLYRYADPEPILVFDVGLYIDTIKNINNSLYDSPMTSKLVSIGNGTISDKFENLKFVNNILDGSYIKCYNLSTSAINDIITGSLNLSDITCDLINDFGITIVTGLKYKSLVKTSLIDYALIFEYATQTGSKNMVITTENFDLMQSDEQLGIFMDSNSELTNTNYGNISAIDANLIQNNLFRSSLTFDNQNVPVGVITIDPSDFYKYMMNRDFINHNRIKSSKVYWITDKQIIDSGIVQFVSKIINSKTYYISECYYNSNLIADKYNIQNILIEIDMENDFGTIGMGSPSTYDLYKDPTLGYRIYNGTDWYALNPKFKLREIALYYKNTSDEFIPVYYARTNFIINNSGTYTFQIII